MTQTRPEPTAAELEILQVLWEHGPSTVAFVNEKLNERRKVGYTTTLKLMQIMSEKALVERDRSRRAHVYSPRVGAGETQSNLVSNLIDRAFRGSAGELVVKALSSRPASPAELEEIRRLLDEMEEKSR